MLNHRVAFETKSQNLAIEHNLEKVVNLTSLKLKEMINRKQDKIREGSHLKAQNSVLESDIAYYEKETKEKMEELNRLNEEFTKTLADIEALEAEYKQCLDEYDNQNLNYTQTVSSVSQEFDSILVASGIEETNKKSDMRLEYENWLKIKSENKNLMDKVHELRRELYYLEVILFIFFQISYKKAADDEIQRIYKTRKGIETINKMDRFNTNEKELEFEEEETKEEQ